MPKMEYSGQVLIKLVNTNTAPSTSNTIPSVPVTVLVKYRAAKIAANTSLMILSAEPMFFFIVNSFMVL